MKKKRSFTFSKVLLFSLFYVFSSFAGDVCAYWYQPKTQKLDDHGDLDFTKLPLHFLNNPSIQPSVAFYYVKESLKQTIGIVSSSNTTASAESTLGRATDKISKIQELQAQLEAKKKDLKSKISLLKDNSIPLKVKLTRDSNNYRRERRQEIVTQVAEISHIINQIKRSADALAELKQSLNQSIVDLEGSEKKAKAYLRYSIQLSEYIVNLNSSHLGSNGVESAGVLFSLFSQEIRTAANDLALLEYSRNTLTGQRALTGDLHRELSEVEVPSLQTVLQESGLSELATSDFMAAVKTDSEPTTPKLSIAERLSEKRKKMGASGWISVALAIAIGPGLGGYQAVDYAQTVQLESQISSINPQAGKMLEGILAIDNPIARNAQIDKFVATFQDQLSAAQVLAVADKLLDTGKDGEEKKKYHVSELVKKYTDHIAAGKTELMIERRAPGITKLLALVKQTGTSSDANKLAMDVYQKYKSELTLEDVILIKSYFRNKDGGWAPTSEWSEIDLDFAKVLSSRK